MEANFGTVVDKRLAALMGAEPTRWQHGEAMHKVTVTAEVANVVPVRRSGETKLAFAELPLPVAGPMPAWEQFLARLSDRDAFLAWCHTLTIDRFEGRQALYLFGGGHDGKSSVLKVLGDALGPCGTIIDKATGNERFRVGELFGRGRAWWCWTTSRT